MTRLDPKRLIAVREQRLSGMYLVGALRVPKPTTEGTYPAVDVWTDGAEFAITPYGYRKREANLYIGYGTLGLTSIEDNAYYCGQHFRRIHAVTGVWPRGCGFGYTLYAAAALALLKHRTLDHGIFSPRGSGSDVPGGGDRTKDAHDVWWALSTHGTDCGPLAWTCTATLQVESIDHTNVERVQWPIDVITTESVLHSGLVIGLTDKKVPFVKSTKPLAELRYRRRHLAEVRRGS